MSLYLKRGIQRTLNSIKNSTSPLIKSSNTKKFLKTTTFKYHQRKFSFISKRFLQTMTESKVMNATTSSGHNGDIQLPFDLASLKRGCERSKLNISVGDKIHGYTAIGKRYIEERNITVYHLIHDKTGAGHFHIECDDLDNVFYITFKTLPDSNKGVAHILEHLTLCGSDKYPVRDPFFNMIKRSLNTYMNAWTGYDFTGYPFSTQNAKDYYNLMSIYLDAVFFSRLEYLDFLQEGHRLEFNKETGTLEHKGVVYNEMKGVMSDPSNLFVRERKRHIYPTTTYHYNSGGDPQAIREITYEELKNFKNKFYHPSNSYTITYGDLPLQPHLEFINEYMNRFERTEPESSIPDEQRYDEPRRIVFQGPLSSLSDPDKQVKVSVSWLVNRSTNLYERFSMYILSYLLTNGPNSPMYQALISSNIGSSYAPGTGFSGTPKEGSFSVGLSDIAEKDIDMVENLIYETLEKAYKDGFTEKRIESVIHQLEYSMKNITSGFGLDLASDVASYWIHEGNPLDSFITNELIEKLRNDIQSGPYFQNLIKKWLIDNKHRITFIMLPSKDYGENVSKEEENSIKEIMEHPEFENSIKPKVIEESRALQERQDQKDDVNVLPKIRISEVDRKGEKVISTKSTINNVPITWNNQPTNDIVYFNACFDISDIPEDILIYIPLFCKTFYKMGTKNRDYKDLSQEIELKTGSFSSSNSVVNIPESVEDYNLEIRIGSSCLIKNVKDMFDLWEDVLNNVVFDDLERLRTLIGNIMNNLNRSIINSGHTYAKLIASKSILPSYEIRELWSGLSQYKFIRSLNEKEDISEVAQILTTIAHKFFNRNRLKIAINAESKNFDNITQQIDNLVSSINFEDFQKGKVTNIYKKPENLIKTYIGLEVQVNYVSQCYKAAPYTHEDRAKLAVLTQLLTHNYLHKEIREKGGAYGGGISMSNGSLSFYSYRDPKVKETLDAYKNSIEWVLSGDFNDDDIEEAKLQLFASLDSPTPPGSKGLDEFFYGITWEMRQQLRERIFDVTKEDVIQVCKNYFADCKETSIAVLGSKHNTEYKDNKDWLYQED